MKNKSKKKCFVLMPFEDKLKEIYTEVYKTTCSENDIDCWRVDEISRPGSITRDIVEGILDAEIIIADLTAKNPNVFYELGIAHSTGNKTIMTAQSKEDVPFDIAAYRVIFYEHTLTGCKRLKEQLDLAIKELLAALNRTSNPFQEVIASRGGFRVKGRTPIINEIPYTSLSMALKNLFEKESILYLEDLKRLNLTELSKIEGFGKASMAQLCTIISKYELYDNVKQFHNFVIKNKINLHDNKMASVLKFR
jgi:hypothetical protein